MEREVEVRFERIEALLHAMAERGNQIEARFNRRMDRAEARMNRAEARTEALHREAMERLDRAEKKADQRMDKFDQRMEATRKLVEAGMKLMVKMNTRIDEMQSSLVRVEKLIVRSLDTRNGHRRNGSH